VLISSEITAVVGPNAAGKIALLQSPSPLLAAEGPPPAGSLPDRSTLHGDRSPFVVMIALRSIIRSSS
jgi:ABC-type hemin transport system ATPase subunit